MLGGLPLIGEQARWLRPSLTTRYTRVTLLPDAAGVRATLDRDVAAAAPDGRRVGLPGMAIVESKSPGPPSEIDRLLWRMGYRPTKISKFCTSLAVLVPGLPANKWARALRQPWSLLASTEPAVPAPLPAPPEPSFRRFAALAGA